MLQELCEVRLITKLVKKNVQMFRHTVYANLKMCRCSNICKETNHLQSLSKQQIFKIKIKLGLYSMIPKWPQRDFKQIMNAAEEKGKNAMMDNRKPGTIYRIGKESHQQNHKKNYHVIQTERIKCWRVTKQAWGYYQWHVKRQVEIFRQRTLRISTKDIKESNLGKKTRKIPQVMRRKIQSVTERELMPSHRSYSVFPEEPGKRRPKTWMGL